MQRDKAVPSTNARSRSASWKGTRDTAEKKVPIVEENREEREREREREREKKRKRKEKTQITQRSLKFICGRLSSSLLLSLASLARLLSAHTDVQSIRSTTRQ